MIGVVFLLGVGAWFGYTMHKRGWGRRINPDIWAWVVIILCALAFLVVVSIGWINNTGR